MAQHFACGLARRTCHSWYCCDFYGGNVLGSEVGFDLHPGGDLSCDAYSLSVSCSGARCCGCELP